MKFKKARKIFRLLFPKRISETQLFENKLRSNILIKNFVLIQDKYEIELLNGVKLFLRNQNHSDYEVFVQIFNFEEYKLIVSILKSNPKFNNSNNILIDAGANVGFTTNYFINEGVFSDVYCIEPSLDNISILKQNIQFIKNKCSIKIYRRALTGKENLRYNLHNNFRSRKDWAISVEEDPKGLVEGITINEIILQNNIKTITLLKIDIEGAERFIFDTKNDLSFLNNVKIIAIEIHDEFDVRESIYLILLQYDFFIFESGELTIGLNRKYI
ncbi:FkbM family methyltransferase [Flavobacterium sp. ZT3R17]|uniref:FkbM family methyltransferase n=1 Tax=Flavobacterium cryoconiti TaxID=3398736 RepID=UPI003A892339